MTTDGARRKAEREAATWFAKLRGGALAETDRARFERWRQEPSNIAAYEAIERLWSVSAGVGNDPELAPALARARRPRRSPARRFPLWAPAVLALATVVTAAVLIWPSWNEVTHATTVGETRRVVLADGSNLILDTDTRVRVSFRNEGRLVRLDRGRALFAVAADADRPFIVRAGDEGVRALGTRFTVRRDGDRVEVLLLEGRVSVAAVDIAHRPASVLSPGDRVVVTEGSQAAPRRSVITDQAAAISWTEGRIVFDRTPLAAAVAELNRYETRPLRLAEGLPDETPVSGSFTAGRVDAFAEAVARLNGWTVVEHSDGPVMHLKAD